LVPDSGNISVYIIQLDRQTEKTASAVFFILWKAQLQNTIGHNQQITIDYFATVYAGWMVIFTFPIDWTPNGNEFGVKSIGSV